MQRFSKEQIRPVFNVLLIAVFVKAAMMITRTFGKEFSIAAGYLFSDVVPFVLYFKFAENKVCNNADLHIFANPALLAGSTYFMSMVLNLLLSYLGIQSGQYDYFFGNSPQNEIVVVHAVIIAPIIEEFVFRKVIYCAAQPCGRTFAIMFSSLVFALFHPTAFVHSLLFGLLLAYVAAGGNLLPAIIIHSVVNLVSCIPPFVREILDKALYEVFFSIYNTAVFAFGIVCTAVCTVGFLRFRNEQKS